MDDVKLLTTADVAALFRVSPSTVARWVKDGRLDGIRTPGGQLRFHEHKILPLLAPEAARPLRAVDAA